MNIIPLILTTGLVWLCFWNQSTVICVVILLIKCPLQLFFNSKGVNDTAATLHLRHAHKNHHAPGEMIMALLVSQRWAWFKWVIALTQQESIHDQQKISGGLVSTPIILWDTGSQENRQIALSRHTGELHFLLDRMTLGCLFRQTTQWWENKIKHQAWNITIQQLSGSNSRKLLLKI